MNIENAIVILKKLQFEMTDVGYGDMSSILTTDQIKAIDIILKELEKTTKKNKELLYELERMENYGISEWI